jgi:hypothetical protein
LRLFGRLSRRTLLRGTAAAALGPVSASAFTIEPLPLAVEELYLRACQVRQQALHERLIADVEALLADRPLDSAERNAVLRSVACPICGCAIFAGR